MNLRINADFEVPIAKNVFWVPVNTLGGTRYTNKQITEMVNLTPEEKVENINTLYEAVQLFLMSQFHDTLDVVCVPEGGYNWEHHKPGYYAVLTNCGCCASEASWLRYILENKYEGMGYFAFSRPTGSGHVYNYIRCNGWYYLYDLCPLADCNMQSALVETGNRLDYLKTKYISGALIKCKSLEDYAKYFRRLQLRGGFEHLFFEYQTREVPPIAINRERDYVTIIFPDNISVRSILACNNTTMRFEVTSAPFSQVCWDKLVTK